MLGRTPHELLRIANSSSEELMLKSFPGGYSSGVTPDTIPNSAVKPARADDTATGGKVGRCQGFFPSRVCAEPQTRLCLFGLVATSLWCTLTNVNTIPEIIKLIGFDFHWKNSKVWALSVAQSAMPISELVWHFDIPFLDHNNGRYNLRPLQVIESPESFKSEYERTMAAELDYPIDIMENKGRWLILDGLHRLMKSYILKYEIVNVRKIPRGFIKLITPEDHHS